jgi:ProP effector
VLYEPRRRPLKLGIHHDLLALDCDAKTLRAALGKYTNNPGYLRNCQTGTPRIDLNGDVAGEVTADEAAHAKAQLDGRGKKRAVQQSPTKPTSTKPAKKPLSLSDLKAAAQARKADTMGGDHVE